MIEITDFTKNYPGFNLNISLSLPSGRVTGIVGRNGAGKSTTIKAILGLVTPDSGQVKVFGKEAASLSSQDKRRLGVALSESGFSNYITLNSISKILKNMYPAFDEELFFRLAKEQQLPTGKLVKEFSTGMKAKLKVLAAITHGADLLILDEPTAGLDVIARNDILDLLRMYMAEDDNRSILVTSHISSDLEGLCDDIYMIHDGKFVLHEDTDVLTGKYAVLKVSGEMFRSLDRKYIMATKKSSFGYSCLTGEKQFYLDNYPGIVVENGSIDDLIIMLAGNEGRN